MHKFDVPRLPHLKEFLDENSKHIMDEPIQVRKGFSYKVMLGKVFTSHRWLYIQMIVQTENACTLGACPQTPVLVFYRSHARISPSIKKCIILHSLSPPYMRTISCRPQPGEGGKVYAYSENFDTFRIDPKVRPHFAWIRFNFSSSLKFSGKNVNISIMVVTMWRLRT